MKHKQQPQPTVTWLLGCPYTACVAYDGSSDSVSRWHQAGTKSDDRCCQHVMSWMHVSLVCMKAGCAVNASCVQYISSVNCCCSHCCFYSSAHVLAARISDSLSSRFTGMAKDSRICNSSALNDAIGVVPCYG